MLGKVAERVKEWINNGWVEEVKGKPNRWNSPLFTALKISGGERVKEEIRLCIDFRQVNEKTKSIVYTLPTTVEMFSRTRGAKVFSELDLSAAYHQVETKSATARMLGFTAPNDRQYVWRRMSFGLKGAPTHFQQMVEQVVGEVIKFTRVYVDNFLIHSELVKEHVEHLLIIIQSLTEAGFRLNVEKYRLGYRKMKFMGNIIDGETRTLEKKKVESIQGIQRLKSGKQVESFLGLLNFLRDYILMYSDLVGLLEGLRKWKRIEEKKWTKEYDDALKKIKEVIGMALVLHHLDWEKKFIVATDASQYGVGAVLYQVINGKICGVRS
jgi:hypothetical protein